MFLSNRLLQSFAICVYRLRLQRVSGRLVPKQLDCKRQATMTCLVCLGQDCRHDLQPGHPLHQSRSSRDGPRRSRRRVQASPPCAWAPRSLNGLHRRQRAEGADRLARRRALAGRGCTRLRSRALRLGDLLGAGSRRRRAAYERERRPAPHADAGSRSGRLDARCGWVSLARAPDRAARAGTTTLKSTRCCAKGA